MPDHPVDTYATPACPTLKDHPPPSPGLSHRQVFTSVRRFKDDLTAHTPDHLVCVPLVLETLYTKVGGGRPWRQGALAGIRVQAVM